MHFKSKKELNYDKFVDLNILGAARLVHSDLRIYQISFFLLDILYTKDVGSSSNGSIYIYIKIKFERLYAVT